MNLAPRCQSIPIKLCPIFGRNSAAVGRLPAPGKKRSSIRSSGWMSWAWLKSGRLGECQAVRQSRYWPPALSSRLDEVAALEAGSKDGRDLLSGAGSCLGAEVEVASRRRPTFRGHDSRPLDSRPPSHPTGQTFYDPTHFIIVCKKLY